MSPFLLGINYWPRRSAMYMWRRFDLGEIREDLARIKGLGLHVVRFFLLWDDFQPAPDRMDADMLRRFDAMMNAIAGAGLQAMPTLFCGHMSGVNWLPSWSLDTQRPHGRFRTIANGSGTSPFGVGDFYHDPFLLDAQAYFAHAVAERTRDHPALYGWDLGNEFSNLRDPQSSKDAVDWSTRLTHVLKASCDAIVTAGTHGEDLERDRNIRPSSIAAPWDIATMHGYSAYATFARDVHDTSVVPFYAELMQRFSGKPLLFTEFGNPTCPSHPVSYRMPCLSEEDMPAYAYGVLDKLHARGALGAFWWCWADYSPALASLPPFDDAPHELTFGLVRSDGSFKPVAQTLSRFAAEGRKLREPNVRPLPSEADFYASLPRGIISLYRRLAR